MITLKPRKRYRVDCYFPWHKGQGVAPEGLEKGVCELCKVIKEGEECQSVVTANTVLERSRMKS